MKISEHRAAARIAWRHARRAKGRTALVLLLIALPIAGLAGGGILMKTGLPTPEDQANTILGSADMHLNSFSQDLTTQRILSALPAGTRVTSVKEASVPRLVKGTLISMELWEYSTPPDQAPASARYKLVGGRMPHAPNEVTISPALASTLDKRVGDVVDIDEIGLHLKVVGLAVSRDATDMTLGLLGTGTLPKLEDAGNSFIDWLIDLPPGVSPEQAVASSGVIGATFGFETRQMLIDQRMHDQKLMTGAAFALSGFGLFATCLIAMAALGVGARRQLRALGLVGAGGGETRHIKAIVLWGGGLQGLVGSTIGIVLAVAAGFIAHPYLDGMLHRVVGPVNVPWWAIAGGLALGTLAATLAAIIPARQAAQISTVDALAGRTPHPRGPGKLARWGVGAVIVGGLLVAVGSSSEESTLVAIALVVTITGFLLGIPLLVTWVGRLSTHMSATTRIAARQTARYGRRTGTAVAAATLALTLPVAISALTLSNERRDNQSAVLADDQLLLSSVSPASNEVVPDSILRAAQTAVPGSTVSKIRLAFYPIDVGSLPPQKPGLSLARKQGEIGNPVWVEGLPISKEPGVLGISSESLAIGDADLLRAAHAEDGIPFLSSGKIIAAGLPTDNGFLRVNAAPRDPNGSQTLTIPAVQVRGRGGSGQTVTHYFISEAGARKYGFEAGPVTQALLRAQHPLTKAEIDRAKDAVEATPGGYVQSMKDFQFDASTARLLTSLAALVLALIIVAVTVALVSAESRREQAILVSVGAAPKTRRRVAATNAFLMTALAGVLAVPAGFVPMMLILMTEGNGNPIVVPWISIGIVALGAPLVGGLVAGLVSREPKARALLQPVW